MKSNMMPVMRRMVMVVAIAVSASAIPVFADKASDEAAIRQVWVQYSAARVAGDAETWLSLWDHNGIQMPPNVPARAFDALKIGIPKAFAAGGVSSMTITPDEVVVTDGGWAYGRGTYVSDRTVNGKKVSVDGKFITILKREPDGTWKIYRDIFNSNKP